MTNRPIIVFDSGKGGQSIYVPLRAALPTAEVIYIDDHENFPYGEKSQAWLSERFGQLGQQFLALNPRLVVIACNTATVNIIGELRKILPCPIVGVEPVIKPLAKYHSALVLMTQAAAESSRTAELLALYGPQVRVYVPHNLAEAIEFNKNEQVKKSIKEIKKVVQKQHIEAVGLSCTHYPLVLPELHAAMPGIIFIDPAPAVIQEVIRVLRLKDIYE